MDQALQNRGWTHANDVFGPPRPWPHRLRNCHGPLVDPAEAVGAKIAALQGRWKFNNLLKAG